MTWTKAEQVGTDRMANAAKKEVFTIVVVVVVVVFMGVGGCNNYRTGLPSHHNIPTNSAKP